MVTLTIRIDDDLKERASKICKQHHTTLREQITLHLKDIIDNGMPIYQHHTLDIHNEAAIIALWSLLASLREDFMQIILDFYADKTITSEVFSAVNIAADKFTLFYPQARSTLTPASLPIWDNLHSTLAQLRTAATEMHSSRAWPLANAKPLPQMASLFQDKIKHFLDGYREFDWLVLQLPRPDGHPLAHDTCRNLIKTLIDADVAMNSSELFYRLLCQRVNEDGVTPHEAFMDVIEQLPTLSLRLSTSPDLDRAALKTALTVAGFKAAEVDHVITLLI
jgi:antitoxin component of RelBE/YafQ-DinJ toxin-antitoxin module